MFFSALVLLSLCFVLFVILFHLLICLCAFATLNKRLLTYLLTYSMSDGSRHEAGSGIWGSVHEKGYFWGRIWGANQWGLYGVRVRQRCDAALFPNYFGQTYYYYYYHHHHCTPDSFYHVCQLAYVETSWTWPSILRTRNTADIRWSHMDQSMRFSLRNRGLKGNRIFFRSAHLWRRISSTGRVEPSLSKRVWSSSWRRCLPDDVSAAATQPVIVFVSLERRLLGRRLRWANIGRKISLD